MKRLFDIFALVAMPLLLTSCVKLPTRTMPICSGADIPSIKMSADGKTASTRLDVLSYNIEGLSWPARSGRAPKLQAIGAHLEALRQKGDAPDIVAFQEMFSKAAVKGVKSSGYPAIISGPSRSQRGALRAGVRLPGKKRATKGELGIRVFASGLAIASRFPIIYSVSEPFSRKSCAGFDCLSNKGVLLAGVDIPGVPEPVQLFNTHMNSQGASRVPVKRHTAAHQAESLEMGMFLENERDPNAAAILAGDFNMRGSSARFEVFDLMLPLRLVHQYCSSGNSGCDVQMSWDGDEPWMDTQDLQLFSSGNRVDIRPIRVEAMFDGRPDSPVLSDHDGFRVVYELSWKVDGEVSASRCDDA